MEHDIIIINNTCVPKIAEGEKQCKREQKQHKTTQRKEHPANQHGNPSKKIKTQNQHLQQKNIEKLRTWRESKSGVLLFFCNSNFGSYLDLKDNRGSGINKVSHRGLKEGSKLASEIDVWRKHNPEENSTQNRTLPQCCTRTCTLNLHCCSLWFVSSLGTEEEEEEERNRRKNRGERVAGTEIVNLAESNWDNGYWNQRYLQRFNIILIFKLISKNVIIHFKKENSEDFCEPWNLYSVEVCGLWN